VLNENRLRSIGWFGAEMPGELLQEFVELADRHGLGGVSHER
jgi:hypothetical protein